MNYTGLDPVQKLFGITSLLSAPLQTLPSPCCILKSPKFPEPDLATLTKTVVQAEKQGKDHTICFHQIKLTVFPLAQPILGIIIYREESIWHCTQSYASRSVLSLLMLLLVYNWI